MTEQEKKIERIVAISLDGRCPRCEMPKVNDVCACAGIANIGACNR